MATQNPYSVMYGIGVNTPTTATIAIISETTNSHIAGAWSFIVSFLFATGRLAGPSFDGLHHNPTLTIHSADCVRLQYGFVVCTENLNPDVVVMKPAKDRV